MAATVSVVLVIEVDQLRRLLADSPCLVEGLFRTLLDSGRLPLQQLARAEPVQAPALGDAAVPSLLDTATTLRQVPLLAGTSAEDALSLAAIARHFVAQPGDVISRQDDPPAVWILLSGEVSLGVPGRADIAPITARAGEVLGLFETLAGIPLGHSQRAVDHTHALRIERDDLLDVMSQHPSLPEHMLGVLFEQLTLTTTTSRSV